MTKALPTTLLEQLAEDASFLRPELFAVYGVDNTGRPFLGWGMQLCDDKAVYHDPEGDITWLTPTADHILRRRRSLGSAHLVWLEP
jgi:hypothetical protein